MMPVSSMVCMAAARRVYRLLSKGGKAAARPAGGVPEEKSMENFPGKP